MNVKTEVSVVTERGQTSIPAHLRRDLSLAKGRRLAWERVADDELRVKILPEPAGNPEALRGFARRFRRPRRSAHWMAELRAGERAK
jgi:bifunctional DNA-binding transcriptional regulator/antitoxin component of YhaV-PrlF toxin-antitoxin module